MIQTFRRIQSKHFISYEKPDDGPRQYGDQKVEDDRWPALVQTGGNQPLNSVRGVFMENKESRAWGRIRLVITVKN